jgi:hypothetical protein
MNEWVNEEINSLSGNTHRNCNWAEMKEMLRFEKELIMRMNIYSEYIFSMRLPSYLRKRWAFEIS